LRVADLIFLNEVDVGMARTGNIHIASELAHALKMNWIFAPAHLELSGNDAADREIHGQNAVGIQGNAILSRYPLGEPRIIELPRGQSLLQTEQKRYGRRIALQATVYTDRGSFCAVCTHLEVFDTPAGRARQMNAILESLASDGEDKAVLLGGDWNTHSFARGTRWRTLHAYLRVLWANPEQLVYKLKHPDCDGEKLFASLKRGGYQWEEFNDDADTCGVTLSEEEHVQPWPRFLQGLVRRRLEQHQHQLRFRLDWFASCGLKALRKSEEVESALGISSVSPMTRAEVNDRPQPLSDHHPILVDIQLPPEEATQIRAVA
jgi:endonuclease/exonuclease/phosphatase family metal-dependent hydrolase